MTVFHGITVFREISDHVGLQPGSVLGFTRNSPHKPVLSFFLHPHENNYHLTHHLAPSLPWYQQLRLHRRLVGLLARVRPGLRGLVLAALLGQPLGTRRVDPRDQVAQRQLQRSRVAAGSASAWTARRPSNPAPRPRMAT